jgi:hypothetical protein
MESGQLADDDDQLVSVLVGTFQSFTEIDHRNRRPTRRSRTDGIADYTWAVATRDSEF